MSARSRFVRLVPEVHRQLLEVARATCRSAPDMIEVIIRHAHWALQTKGALAPELHLPPQEGGSNGSSGSR